jgi:hypothetical protein
VARVQQQLHPKTNQEGKEPVMTEYKAKLAGIAIPKNRKRF